MTKLAPCLSPIDETIRGTFSIPSSKKMAPQDRPSSWIRKSTRRSGRARQDTMSFPLLIHAAAMHLIRARIIIKSLRKIRTQSMTTCTTPNQRRNAVVMTLRTQPLCPPAGELAIQNVGWPQEDSFRFNLGRPVLQFCACQEWV